MIAHFLNEQITDSANEQARRMLDIWLDWIHDQCQCHSVSQSQDLLALLSSFVCWMDGWMDETTTYY